MSSRGSGLSRWRAAYRIITTAPRSPRPLDPTPPAGAPPRGASRRTRAGLIAVLLAATGAVAYVGVRGFLNVGRLIDLSEEVDRSRVRLASLAEAVSRVRAAETGQRGFLLTGRPEYLARYKSSREGVFAEIEGLARQYAGLEAERTALTRARAAAVEKFAEMGRTIELVEAGRRDDAVALVRSDSGERLKEEILARADEVAQSEGVRLAELRRQADRAADHAPAVLLVLLGGTLVVVVGLYDAMARGNRERRRAEGVLRESERRFRGGFEAAAVGMALVGTEGRLLKVNAALCEMLGRDEAELLTLDFQALTHPDDLEPDLALVRRTLSGDIDTYQLEKRYVHRDGRAIHAVLSASLVRDEGGRPLHFVSQVQDITPRVVAEREAERERRFIERIAATVPLMLYVFDLRRQQNAWSNGRLGDITGIPMDRIEAMGEEYIRMVVHPDDMPRIEAHQRALARAADGEVAEVEYRVRHVDGSCRWLRSRDTPFLRDDGGGVVQVLGSAEDVTDRRRAEAALREETAFRGAILAGSGYAIISADERGTIRVFNPAAERLTGYAAEELVGRHTPEVFHDADEVARRAAELSAGGPPVAPGFEVFVAAARRGEIEERDWTYIRKDGARVPVRLAVTALRGADGWITGFLGIASDRSEAARAEAALRESERRYRFFFEMIPQLVWSCDARGRADDCNGRWREYTGQSLAEFAGLGWLEAVHPDDLARASAAWVAAFASDRHYESEYRLRSHDGEYRWHLAQGEAMLDERGEIVRWFGTCTDVHGQEEAAAALRLARDAAQAAARAKAEFLANMSHEIRTPMNGVLGMAELALDTELTARQREYVAAIRSSAESLLTVINDILDFSKVEAGKLELDRAPFALRALIDDALRGFAPRAHEKGLELCARTAPGVPDVLVGDPHRLRQVVVNLVGNAIKFTESGEVVISVDLDPDGPADDGAAALAFSVRDTGIGVPDGRRAAIFAPFEQADGSTTRRYGGTGLGLSISSRLVELMGGRIWVEEGSGGGSLFRFTARFGRADAEAERALAAPDAPASLAGRPVLVVDDNATGRGILAEMLAGWGMVPTAVADAVAALEAARAARGVGRPFAAALVDGEPTARDLTGAGVPLILLEAEAPGAGSDAAAEVVARLAKPVRQSALFNVLVSLAGGAPVAGPALPDAAAPDRVRPGRALRILLAEDHPVNQVVATRMLERLGHRTVVVRDGREALAALDGDGPFDLVLMDLQMPGMDGLQAVAAIRDRERASLFVRRTPVVALTAHAMTGDRERCLAAGFDGYLPKPIRADDLARALAEFGGAARAELPTGAAAVFRPDVLADSCDGEPGIIAEVLDSFIAGAPADLHRIVVALASGDLPAARRAAHGVKGACATVGAEALAAACHRIERLDDESSCSPEETREALADAWASFLSAIEAHRDTPELARAAT